MSDIRSNSEEKTEAWYGNEYIQRRVLEFYPTLKEELEACFDHSQVTMHVTYDAIRNGLLSLKERGIKLKCISEVTSENIISCKKLMEIAEVKHLAGIKSNFSIADRKGWLLYAISNEEQPLSHAIYSNVKGIVEAQQYLFETLWNKAIPVKNKIEEIEQGTKPVFIDSISDVNEIHMTLCHLLRSTNREILLILPTINTFYRYEKEGVIQVLKEEAEHGIKIRILMPPIKKETIKELIEIPLIEIEHHDKLLDTKLIIIVSDIKLVLTISVIDDSKERTNEAVEFATYSNSKPTVNTYESIFETLWMQAELNKSKQTYTD